MKSKLIEVATKAPDFPKLMISNKGDVILFSEESIGIVVHGPDGYDEDEGKYSEGFYCKTWPMDWFKDFNGVIELSNK